MGNKDVANMTANGFTKDTVNKMNTSFRLSAT